VRSTLCAGSYTLRAIFALRAPQRVVAPTTCAVGRWPIPVLRFSLLPPNGSIPGGAPGAFEWRPLIWR
jgi:hypothetical protein